MSKWYTLNKNDQSSCNVSNKSLYASQSVPVSHLNPINEIKIIEDREKRKYLYLDIWTDDSKIVLNQRNRNSIR